MAPALALSIPTGLPTPSPVATSYSPLGPHFIYNTTNTDIAVANVEPSGSPLDSKPLHWSHGTRNTSSHAGVIVSVTPTTPSGPKKTTTASPSPARPFKLPNGPAWHPPRPHRSVIAGRGASELSDRKNKTKSRAPTTTGYSSKPYRPLWTGSYPGGPVPTGHSEREFLEEQNNKTKSCAPTSTRRGSQPFRPDATGSPSAPRAKDEAPSNLERPLYSNATEPASSHVEPRNALSEADGHPEGVVPARECTKHCDLQLEGDCDGPRHISCIEYKTRDG